MGRRSWCLLPRCDCEGVCRKLARPKVRPQIQHSSTLVRYDGAQCAYCLATMSRYDDSRFPTRDHLIPRSRGGGNGTGNRIICCQRCNNDKRDLSLRQWYNLLVRKDDYRAGYVWLVLNTRREGDDTTCEVGAV